MCTGEGQKPVFDTVLIVISPYCAHGFDKVNHDFVAIDAASSTTVGQGSNWENEKTE